MRLIPNSLYGNSLMSYALPDAKPANCLIKNTLNSYDLILGGMWIAQDDRV